MAHGEGSLLIDSCPTNRLGAAPSTDLSLRYGQWSRGWRFGLAFLIAGLASLVVTGCSSTSRVSPRYVVIQQAWELEIGDFVAGYQVTGSLGDISIHLKGHAVRAPFAGEIEPAEIATSCVYFSTPEVPAYLFRLCGLRHPRLGPILPGNVIGSGEFLHFATLRRQPDGSWAIVEPSSNVLERALRSPARPSLH